MHSSLSPCFCRRRVEWGGLGWLWQADTRCPLETSSGQTLQLLSLRRLLVAQCQALRRHSGQGKWKWIVFCFQLISFSQPMSCTDCGYRWGTHTGGTRSLLPGRSEWEGWRGQSWLSAENASESLHMSALWMLVISEQSSWMAQRGKEFSHYKSLQSFLHFILFHFLDSSLAAKQYWCFKTLEISRGSFTCFLFRACCKTCLTLVPILTCTFHMCEGPN